VSATQLSLYNGALRLCRDRKLISLSENREPRRLLDAAWGDGSTTGAVKACLEIGQWDFATRTVMIDSSPSVEPPFGLPYAFDRPADLVRTTGVWQDEFCKVPLLDYVNERGYWYAAIDPIYVSYVSNAPEYGADTSLWPESFVKLVEAYLANEIVGNLTQGDAQAERVFKMFDYLRKQAKKLDAIEQPTRLTPAGSWTRARRNGWGGDRLTANGNFTQ
jgi:hypothetical protein